MNDAVLVDVVAVIEAGFLMWKTNSSQVWQACCSLGGSCSQIVFDMATMSAFKRC